MATLPAGALSKYEIRRRDPDPARCTLLVIDMQLHFASVAAPALKALKSTVDLCRSAGIPVIYTRHLHRDPSDNGMLGEWWPGDLIIDGSPSSQLLDGIGRISTDKIIQKHTYSAFFNTDLDAILHQLGSTEVIITGVMTNLCCETTARDAFVRGFRVFFSTDATATCNDDLHEASLKNLSYGFAYLVDFKRLEAAFLS
ncbi:hypothetical protein LUZ60_016553 [Juncus effusus]|nr:hypothetical protein LUZ60_016553 [Juncus effusus]